MINLVWIKLCSRTGRLILAYWSVNLIPGSEKCRSTFLACKQVKFHLKSRSGQVTSGQVSSGQVGVLPVTGRSGRTAGTRWGLYSGCPISGRPGGRVGSGRVRSGRVGSGQVRSGQVRSGQVRSGQVRSGQVRLGQGGSGLVRSGQLGLLPVGGRSGRACVGPLLRLSHLWPVRSRWSGLSGVPSSRSTSAPAGEPANGAQHTAVVAAVEPTTSQCWLQHSLPAC